MTENRAKPDFIFPGITSYHDALFPADQLTMLGVKTSAKDRWRQVLPEAARIKLKHLLTLEPGISKAQTDETRRHSVHLVLPASIHDAYVHSQRDLLLSVNGFINIVRARQTGC